MKTKIIAGVLLSYSLVVNAAEQIKEVVAQIEPDVQVILSNQECKKWTRPEGVQLNYAYALNTKTGETITGCFTHDDKHIIIELSDDVNGIQHYHFELSPDAFQPRATL